MQLERARIIELEKDNADLRHDIKRYARIAAEQATEIERLNNPKVRAGKTSGALRRELMLLRARIEELEK